MSLPTSSLTCTDSEYLVSKSTCFLIHYTRLIQDSTGTCKTLNGKTSCKSRFPPSLNLAAAILEDLEAADSADLPEGDAAIIQSCREIIDKNIDHSTAYRLGIAMVSFLLVSSVVLNILSVAVSFIAEDAWGFWPTAILTLDALSLFLSLVMCVAVMNYEGGGYLSSLHGGEFSDRKLLGIAVWMLLAMLITRVLSNVWLIIGALAILLPIVLVFVLFLVRTRGFFAAFG